MLRKKRFEINEYSVIIRIKKLTVNSGRKKERHDAKCGIDLCDTAQNPDPAIQEKAEEPENQKRHFLHARAASFRL